MLNVLCDGGLPDRDKVLGQAIPFDRNRWIPLLPDPTWWPPELDGCPVEGQWPRVDRRIVFRIGRHAGTVQGRRHLLVASLVWGSGTKAQSVQRRAKIFAESSAEEIDARLGAALTVLREQGAVEAYWAFNNDQYIRNLGAAFFTKVLYFAGGDSVVGQYRPVILDSVVSRALKAKGVVDASWPESGWKTPQYAQYLEVVHDYAQKQDAHPDQVEAALFCCGKRLR